MMLCLGTAQFVKNYGLNNIQSHNIFELLNFVKTMVFTILILQFYMEIQ